MRSAEIVERLEALYGYDLKGVPGIEREVKSALRAGVGDAEEYWEDLLYSNVHWRGEWQPGDDPFEEDGQPAEVLVRHLSGLLALRTGIPYGSAKMFGTWLVDLNPRSDGLVSPLYFQREGEEEIIGWWLLDAPEALDESHKLFARIQAAHQAVADGADPAQLETLAGRMNEQYPRVCAAFRDWFGRFGMTDLPDGPFEDRGGERLLNAYRSMLPIAEVLITRSEGDVDATLDAGGLDAALALADAEGDYPPALLLRMLASALSDLEAGKDLANEVLHKNLGMPLTRRWAELIVDEAGPFGS